MRALAPFRRPESWPQARLRVSISRRFAPDAPIQRRWGRNREYGLPSVKKPQRGVNAGWPRPPAPAARHARGAEREVSRGGWRSFQMVGSHALKEKRALFSNQTTLAEARGSPAGRSIQNSAPDSSRLRQPVLPLWAWARACTRLRPRPMPGVLALAAEPRM